MIVRGRRWAIEVLFSLAGAQVAAVLEGLVPTRGVPQAIVCDNGPERASAALDAWFYTHGVALSFIDPGKPTSNAFVERFNGTPRDECLNSPGS